MKKKYLETLQMNISMTEHRIFEENICLKALAVEVHIATSIS